MLKDRNDRMVLGAAGIILGAGALVATATGSLVGNAEGLLASTAHAATASGMLAHNDGGGDPSRNHHSFTRRSSGAARGARAADREGGPRDDRADGRSRRRHQLPLLDLRWPGSRTVRAGQGRRHRRGEPEEPRRQLDAAQRRLPRGDWPGRRRRRDGGRSRRHQGLHVQGAEPRPLRLPLRRADGCSAYRQRHVWADPGRAGRRPAEGRP